MIKYIIFCAVAIIGLINLTAAIFLGVMTLLAIALSTPQAPRPHNPYNPHDPSKIN